ncbi:Nrap protein [Rhodofomes roseus]|uniref:U3 small nucleolar RNA-associated protein 22 n=1 Tax=Rhodofomes roseus TaxID=34475 RepID=A0ABQ8JY33_9APHY|nr:Nrap protein [Rhodofomes roseus]KAH9829045.1 Nrap protein [Rhodofomes roseus]
MASSLKRKRVQDNPHAKSKRRHTTPDSEDSGLSQASAHADFEEHESEQDGADEDVGSDASSEGHVELLEPAGDTQESDAAIHVKAPPKGEELRDIKDATDLFRSTSFKLQIDALLPNVRAKYHRSAPLDKFLLSLHTFLNGLPSIPPKHPLAASRDLQKKGVAVPYVLPQPTEDTNWKVAFEKPAEILLVGSWALKTSVKAKDGRRYVVDLAVTMPESLFQEKDYLHSRFFQKRAFYLAVIAAAVSGKKSGLNIEVLYESTNGDPRLTTLVLRPKADGSASDFSSLNTEVRILPVLPSSSPIPVQRLGPSRPNVRASASSDDSASDTPSPIYNSRIIQHLTPKPHLVSTHALKESVPAFSDALALLRVWAHQRGYGVGDRLCVRGFEGRGAWWVGLLECLVMGEEVAENGGQFGGFGKKEKRRPLGKGLSSYQLFKAALDLLARYDFAKNRTVIKSKDGHRFPPEDYASHEAALVDSSSMLNLLAGVPLTSLEMLRYDAQQTLDVLDNSGLSEDPFPLVFLKEQRDVANRFDVVLRIDLSSAEAGNLPPHAILEHGSAYNALIAHLLSTAKRALSNRTRAIAVLHPSSSSRPLSQAQPSNPSTVLLGLVLDTEHAFRLVDHGPPASEQETEEAKQFRDFWGEKAELRRFKDGSIVESVVWTVGSSDERAHIPAMIVRYILGLHLGLSEESIHGWQNGFDGIVRLPENVGKVLRDGRVETGFKAAMSAFDSLVKAMKALDEQLPLAITTVSPISDSLRYTSSLAPVAIPTSVASALPACARYVAPMEIIVEFEKSGRWPDDLRATQKIKLAFFEALATALMGSQKGLRASVIVSSPHAASDIEDQACLEIVTAAGWAFHARIWHDREQLLLERAIDDKPHIPKHVKKNMHMEGDPKERAAATAALEVYRRRFVHAPRHHRAVAALSHRFSAFAGTARLVKRWLAAHWLLEGHVRAEAAELLCAAVFLRGAKSGGDARAGVPGSKERGFARVMELLKDWEWSAGMFVSLYGDDSDAVKDVPPVGVDVKAGARQGVWAIATEVDREGHVWTAEGPDAVVARRVKALAQATWEALKGMEGGNFEVKTLFAHPTEHYDFIVELDPAVLPRYAQGVQADPAIWAKKGKYANARGDDGEAKLLPGFDPARAFHEDLKRVYEHTFVLFHDPLGGHMFGGVWDPSLKVPRPFRVLGGYSSMPVAKDTDKPKEKEKDKSLVVLNESAVLSEIERMGRGLVKRIVVQV